MIIIHVNNFNSLSDTFNMMVITFVVKTQHESDVDDGSQKVCLYIYTSLNLDSSLHYTHHNYKIYFLINYNVFTIRNS